MTALRVEDSAQSATVLKAAPRRDIQALRALAVLLVVANHLIPGRIPGGYIGVDIFFVISGYLITAHLLREADQTGRIDVLAFWARRIKRLIPAASVVLLFSVIVTVVFLPITVRQEALKQIAAAGAYVLNWVLAANSVDYFAAGGGASPVTHYWSLSVEEQFYLAWPMLMIAGLFLYRGRSSKMRKRTLAAILALVFVASLAWGVYSATTNANAAYFQTTGRAWEFAAGGLLAFAPALVRRRRVLIAFLWSAWGVLVVSAFMFNGASGFPGVAALVPVIATAFIIWVGDFEGGLAPSRLTALRPVQVVGDISYSLYLWHWPLITVAPFVLGRTPRVRDLVIVFAISVIAAYLTKRFVEDPVRQSRRPQLARRRWVYAWLAASLALLLGVCFALSARVESQAAGVVESMHSQSIEPSECFGAQAELSGASCSSSHKLADPGMVMLNRLNQNDIVQNGSTCTQGRFPTEVTSCDFGVPAGTERLGVALIGDSHAAVWSAALDEIASDNSLRVHTYLASGCSVTGDSTIQLLLTGDPEPSNLDACGAWRAEVIETIANSGDIDIVVTTARDLAYGALVDGKRVPDSGAGYVEAWSRWLAAGKRVVVINDAPSYPFDVPTCLAMAGGAEDPCAVDLPAEIGPLESAAARITDPEFTFVDFQDVFCDSRLCHSVVGGIPIYYDDNHMNAPFARSFAPALEELGIFRK
jgi:peptidoglycan/LPS O-acetylase OafA/YrhL